MKNINSLLKKTNLKPKERVILFVHNAVKEEREGKSILSETDKYNLMGEGWRPNSNEEIREYNRFNEGWRTAGFAEMDAQTTYLNAENAFLRVMRLLDFFIFRDSKMGLGNKGGLDDLKRGLSKFDNFNEGEALDTILKNSGLEFEQVAYMFAFELMDKDLKDDLITLYPDIKTEKNYLDQEEKLAELLKDGLKPSREIKEKIADLIANKVYNKYAKEWQLWGYYASIPIIDIAKKWADYNNFDYKPTAKDLKEAEGKKRDAKTAKDLIAGDASLDNEARAEAIIMIKLKREMETRAEKENKTIGDYFKDTVIKWLDDDLLDEYKPIFASDDKSTCNNKDTKLTHKELFNKWLEIKGKARKQLDELISKGELKTEKRKEQILEVEQEFTIITGESLYSFKGDFAFAKDFKKQADDFKALGYLIRFLQDNRFIKEYAKLLAFDEIFKRLSKVYEIDLTYKIAKWLDKFKENIAELNQWLYYFNDDLIGETYKKHNSFYLIKTITDDLFFKPEKIKPDLEGLDIYFKEFERILGDDFKL